MAPMAHLTFKAVLDWFMEIDASKWHIAVQASQFDPKEYASCVEPGTGMLTLNVSGKATRNFNTYDTYFSFNSRLNGKEIFLEIPYSAVFMAYDPVSGIPNSFPYFEDHGDMDMDAPFTFNMENPFVHTFAKPVDSKTKDSSNVIELPHSGMRVELKTPTLADLEAMMDGLNYKRIYEHDFSNARTAAKPLTLEEKVAHRSWVVIEGGKASKPKSMPWIDEVYREKQARREAAKPADKVIIGNTMKSTAPEIRSDGASGHSAHFPDLDVSKCVFATRRRQRPNWISVHQGGK